MLRVTGMTVQNVVLAGTPDIVQDPDRPMALLHELRVSRRMKTYGVRGFSVGEIRDQRRRRRKPEPTR